MNKLHMIFIINSSHGKFVMSQERKYVHLKALFVYYNQRFHGLCLDSVHITVWINEIEVEHIKSEIVAC